MAINYLLLCLILPKMVPKDAQHTHFLWEHRNSLKYHESVSFYLLFGHDISNSKILLEQSFLLAVNAVIMHMFHLLLAHIFIQHPFLNFMNLMKIGKLTKLQNCTNAF